MNLRALTPAAWITVACAGAVALAMLAYFLTAPLRAAQEAAKGRAGGIQSQEHTGAVNEAQSVTANAVNSAAASEETSRDNEQAIRAAPGADQAVDPALNRAALERVCRRPSAARTSVCLQFARGAQPSG